jgi:hypothetical protein
MSKRGEARIVTGTTAEEPAAGGFERLLTAPVTAADPAGAAALAGVRIGTIVGFADGGATPLVTYPEQPASGALAARATIDLHAAHIGRDAVLVFQDGHPLRPIVLGCLQAEGTADALAAAPGQVEIDADGQRLVVSAKDRIVLRCGKASLTLTKEGKVIVQGAYVSNQSSGVLRLKGSSVQIN